MASSACLWQFAVLMNACGADDVGAVVVDVGTQFTKIGHAGEDSPRYCIPSVCPVSAIAVAC